MSATSTWTRAACSRARQPAALLDRLLDDRRRDRAHGGGGRGGARLRHARRAGLGRRGRRRRPATLTFMVGGSAAAFERARPLLAAMGKAVIHAGGAGTGQAAKICNNMMLGIQMISVCEAMVLARAARAWRRSGCSRSAAVSSGQCWSLTSYCPVPGPVPGSPGQPRLCARLHHGDDAQGPATGAGGGPERPARRTPLGAEACQLYDLFARGGNEGLDFSAIIKMIAGNAA